MNKWLCKKFGHKWFHVWREPPVGYTFRCHRCKRHEVWT